MAAISEAQPPQGVIIFPRQRGKERPANQARHARLAISPHRLSLPRVRAARGTRIPPTPKFFFWWWSRFSRGRDTRRMARPACTVGLCMGLGAFRIPRARPI